MIFKTSFNELFYSLKNKNAIGLKTKKLNKRKFI